jgi:hypothetical protein
VAARVLAAVLALDSNLDSFRSNHVIHAVSVIICSPKPSAQHSLAREQCRSRQLPLTRLAKQPVSEYRVRLSRFQHTTQAKKMSVNSQPLRRSFNVLGVTFSCCLGKIEFRCSLCYFNYTSTIGFSKARINALASGVHDLHVSVLPCLNWRVLEVSYTAAQ